MEIVSEEGVTLQDIYAGDLWLCAGQSNMEMQMERLRDDFPEEWHDQDFPPIHQFKVNQEWDFSGPREEAAGKWISASRETLHEFSATAWFFAKNLYKKYGIPIGLINTAWGGTPIEAWMSEGTLAEFPAKIAAGKQYADAALREKIAKGSEEAVKAWTDEINAIDSGLAQGWQSADTWGKADGIMPLPGDFANGGHSALPDAKLAGFCGVIWLMRDFDVPDACASQCAKVWLGTIVDSDTVYINGTEIGATSYRYPPRKYTIPPGLLRSGKNQIVIRVVCNNGEGGVTCGKPFRIFSDSFSVELAGTWKYKTGAAAPARADEFFFQRQPMGNFNAMISPVLKHPLKGVIWYQGESNDSNPHDYAKLFRLMIQDWRKKHSANCQNSRELPFFFVQLPIFGAPSDNKESSSWAIIREAQKQALSLPNTGMAAALEFGEWNDIHPLNKKDVGYRLFLAADKILFCAENSSPGPRVLQVTGIRGEGAKSGEWKIYLCFDNCGGGLTVAAPASSHCASESLCGEDAGKAYVSVIGDEGQTRVPVKIEAPNVISIDLSADAFAVKNPRKILYAWANNPRDRQLYNSDGLPVIPFITEIVPGGKSNV